MRLYERTWRIAFGSVTALTLIFIGLAIFTARLAVFPRWYPKDLVGVRLPDCSSYQRRMYVHCHDPQKSLGLEYREFEASEPVKVNGWWVPAKQIFPDTADDTRAQGIVVLVHGGGADRRAMLKHAAYLHNAGYHSLLIDCFNHGLNLVDGRGISFGLNESRSIIAAARWARAQVPEGARLPIFVFGTSQGGFAALKATAEAEPGLIRGTIAENPYISASRVLLEFPLLKWEPKFVKNTALLLISAWLGTWIDELDVARFADRLSSKPLLLIHGTADQVVSVQHSREILELVKAAKGKQPELWIIENGEHEALWNIKKQEFEDRVLAFLGAAATAK